MLKHILSISHPFKLGISDVTLSQEILSTGLTNSTGMHLKTLELNGFSSPPGSDPSTWNLLKCLITCDKLVEIHAHSNGIAHVNHALRTLRSQPLLNPLHLTIQKLIMESGVWDGSDLRSILQCCPNLTSLTINGEMKHTPGHTLESRIPVTEAAPGLTSLIGPYDVVQLLVEGRPLHHVEVRTRRLHITPPIFLEPLAQGSTPLTSLVLGDLWWRDECVLHIAAIFPALGKLRLWTADLDYLVRPVRLRFLALILSSYV